MVTVTGRGVDPDSKKYNSLPASYMFFFGCQVIFFEEVEDGRPSAWGSG